MAEQHSPVGATDGNGFHVFNGEGFRVHSFRDSPGFMLLLMLGVLLAQPYCGVPRSNYADVPTLLLSSHSIIDIIDDGILPDTS